MEALIGFNWCFVSIHAILQAKPPGYSVEFSKLWCANSRSGARMTELA